MPNQPHSNTSTANSTNAVPDSLRPGSPLVAQISSALKTQLAAAATTANLPALVGLIDAMPARQRLGTTQLRTARLSAFITRIDEDSPCQANRKRRERR
jgi:hypothetical protein